MTYQLPDNLKVLTLELALDDLDKIIQKMRKNNYPEEEIAEYVRKRFNTAQELQEAKNEKGV